MAYRKQIEKNRGLYVFGSILFLLAITYIGFNMFDAWRKYKESNRRLEASTQAYLDLTKQYEEVKKRKELEQSSTGYEMHVRSKFNLNKPEENVVFIVSEESEVPLPEEKGLKKFFETFKNFFN